MENKKKENTAKIHKENLDKFKEDMALNVLQRTRERYKDEYPGVRMGIHNEDDFQKIKAKSGWHPMLKMQCANWNNDQP